MNEIDTSKLSDEEKAALAQVDMALKEHNTDNHIQRNTARRYINLTLIFVGILVLVILILSIVANQ